MVCFDLLGNSLISVQLKWSALWTQHDNESKRPHKQEVDIKLFLLMYEMIKHARLKELYF